MKKNLSFWGPFEQFEMETTLTKERIFQKLEAAADHESDRYSMRRKGDGFLFAEKSSRWSGGMRVNNPVVPVASGQISEKDGKRVITVTFRLNLLTSAVMALFYVAFALAFVIGFTETLGILIGIHSAKVTDSLIQMVPLPLLWTLQQIFFRRSVKRMRELFEYTLVFD